MNWKSLFARHILERGYDYYCMDAVENLDVSEDLIRADVSGTEDYEVEISLEDGEITDMYCSCPYAEDGRNCKHMAAVLYEWEDARQECEYESRDDDKEGNEHLDGSVIDYLEEYMERILMKGFSEKEYMPQKLSLVEDMLDKAEKSASGWSRSYAVGKWALKYLELLVQQKASRADMERFCRQHWENSSVRRYYIDLCMKAEDYELALKALDESLVLDKGYAGLLAEYADQKKEIFLLRGDRDAYVKQLWELALRYRPGELKVYKELKAQYAEEEWTQKREKIFRALPGYADVNELYKEAGLYDRLLASVLKSLGLYQLQRYEDVLKTEYPEQLLGKYREEVEKMAYRTSSRRTYQEIAGLLRRMKRLEGGSRLVGHILADWKEKYRNRPAMMDELSRL